MLKFSKCCSMRQVAFGGRVFVTTASLFVLSFFGCSLTCAKLHNSPKALVDQVWQIVNHEYVDGTFNHVDWQATRQSLLSKDYTSREQAYTAIRVALKQLGDPYTRFLDPNQYQALTDETSGETSGVGIAIEMNENNGRLIIVKVLEKSPAFKAGIKIGDEILAINGKSTQGIKVEDASKLMYGKVGAPITFKIERAMHHSFNVNLTRANLELPTVSYTVKPSDGKRIGYIRLTEFSATSPNEMRRAIQALKAQHVDGYLLDLRGDPGGLVDSSVAIARMWLDNGVIVREVDRIGKIEEFKAEGTALTKQPLVVLVDGDSASASEILTAALKDNNRAVVVGSQTFGKALVQEVVPLSDGCGLAVTIEHYFTPKGTDIGHKGITPDVKIDLTQPQQQQLEANPALFATQSDPQYTHAIAVLGFNQK
ncbi:MAG: S41 family peptidase [Rhizonema sp. PD38]|nr:S41 family peptidase [Rhizonema sp. PD38]